MKPKNLFINKNAFIFSFCKAKHKNIWIKYDDEEVQQINYEKNGNSSETLQSSSFYMLFYTHEISN